MKKYFSLASALMLALGMGMTSCSNDLDEVQAPIEQQPELHKLYLNATAPNTPETRAYVEGVEGYDDAIKITGWNNGDKLYGIYQNVTMDLGGGMSMGNPASVEFTFNGTAFVSEDTSVSKEQIKYFLNGKNPAASGSWDNFGSETISAVFTFGGFDVVDIANNSTDIPMWGVANIVGEKLEANMQLPSNLALVCVHNDSGSEIVVSMDQNNGSSTATVKSIALQYTTAAKFLTRAGASTTPDLTATIPAGGKAYLPIRSGDYDYTVKVNGTDFRTRTGSTIEARKVYKLVYTGA